MKIAFLKGIIGSVVDPLLLFDVLAAYLSSLNRYFFPMASSEVQLIHTSKATLHFFFLRTVTVLVPQGYFQTFPLSYSHPFHDFIKSNVFKYLYLYVEDSQLYTPFWSSLLTYIFKYPNINSTSLLGYLKAYTAYPKFNF